MFLALHDATKVSYFFSILFHNDFGQTQSILDLIKVHFPELQIHEKIFSPSNNPLLSYYAKQMGQDEKKLQRIFCHAVNPIPRDHLASFKLRALELERNSFKPFRMLNIDPGYVALEQMILSSHKPFTHRIYLQQGIYAELEYLYRDQKWQELPWTYPDYNEEEKKQYFLTIRRSLI